MRNLDVTNIMKIAKKNHFNTSKYPDQTNVLYA